MENEQKTSLINDLSVISHKFDSICKFKKEINNNLSHSVYLYNVLAEKTNDLVSDINSYINTLNSRLNDKIQTLFFINYPKYSEKPNDYYFENKENIIYFSPEDDKFTAEITEDTDKSFNLLKIDRDKTFNDQFLEIKNKIDTINSAVEEFIEKNKTTETTKEQELNLLKKPKAPRHNPNEPSLKLMIAMYIISAVLIVSIGSIIYSNFTSTFNGNFMNYLSDLVTKEPPLFILFIIGAIFLLVALILSFARIVYLCYVKIWKKYRTKYNIYTKNYTDLKMEIKFAKDMIAFLEETKTNYNATLENDISTLNEKREKYDNSKPEDFQKVKDGICEIKFLENENEEIQGKMLQKYGSTLTKRDWKNTVLIISYISSGRADSVKEALSFVDREHQVNEIIRSINSIYGRIIDLEWSMRENSNDIKRSIDASKAEMDRNLQQIKYSTEKNKEIYKQLYDETKKLVSATERGNRLMEESNRTNDNLYRDLKNSSFI